MHFHPKPRSRRRCFDSYRNDENGSWERADVYPGFALPWQNVAHAEARLSGSVSQAQLRRPPPYWIECASTSASACEREDAVSRWSSPWRKCKSRIFISNMEQAITFLREARADKIVTREHSSPDYFPDKINPSIDNYNCNSNVQISMFWFGYRYRLIISDKNLIKREDVISRRSSPWGRCKPRVFGIYEQYKTSRNFSARGTCG